MAPITPLLAGVLGGSELWIIILVVVVLFLGPAKLPALARSVRQAMDEFKKGHDHAEPAKPAEPKKDAPQPPSSGSGSNN